MSGIKIFIHSIKGRTKRLISRRKIREIMDKYRLISNYTVKQYKVHRAKCNGEKVENIVNREFDNRDELEMVINRKGKKDVF